MNEHDLETLLAGLQPRGPSSALNQRVEHELELDRHWMHAPLPRRQRLWTPVFWSSLGAAAAVLVMSLLPANPTVGTSTEIASIPSPTVLPVSTIREVVDAQNEGIQYNADSRLPEQHVKLMTLERHAWIDPRDGAHITLEMPREDSVILPVNFQ